MAEAAGDDTWRYPWPVGTRLADELPELIDCRGRRVADLGCGSGQLGMRARDLGARAVCFADGNPDAIAALHERSSNDTALRCVVHHWGSPLPGAPYDLILGGDICYRADCLSDLLATIAGSLAKGGTALLSDPRRHPCADWTDPQANLDWTWASRPAGYTLIVIHKR